MSFEVALICVLLVVLAAMVSYIIRTRVRPRRLATAVIVAPPVFDWCEICGEEATHELGGPITDHGAGGFSAMIACYCADHAPDKAVRVR